MRPFTPADFALLLMALTLYAALLWPKGNCDGN